MDGEDFVTYEQAKILQKYKFVEECRDCYVETVKGDTFREEKTYTNHIPHDGCVACPTLSQAAKWLREKYELHILLDMTRKGTWYYNLNNLKYHCSIFYDDGFVSYESALSAGLEMGLKFIKNVIK